MILISGCTTYCKIDDCRNESYKNGLCEEHYNVKETVNEISEDISPDDYILPECDIRIYNQEELGVLSAEELRLARNEIYARHGRIFTVDDLKGEEYIWVGKYYISNDTLYVEGSYCDGVRNPNAEYEGEAILFYPTKDTVTVRVDNRTEFQRGDVDNIND